MEILAYVAVALVLVAGGIWLQKYLDNKYDFLVYSLESIIAALVTLVVWVLAYFLYEPGTADALWIEIASGFFVFGLGIATPLWLLVRDIRGSNVFWGFLAFIYQLLAASTAVLLVVLLVARLLDKD
jgi:hypothetical protein